MSGDIFWCVDEEEDEEEEEIPSESFPLEDDECLSLTMGNSEDFGDSPS